MMTNTENYFVSSSHRLSLANGAYNTYTYTRASFLAHHYKWWLRRTKPVFHIFFFRFLFLCHDVVLYTYIVIFPIVFYKLKRNSFAPKRIFQMQFLNPNASECSICLDKYCFQNKLILSYSKWRKKNLISKQSNKKKKCGVVEKGISRNISMSLLMNKALTIIYSQGKSSQTSLEIWISVDWARIRAVGPILENLNSTLDE